MVLLIPGLTCSAERIVEDDAVLNLWDVEPSPAADFLIFSSSFLPLIRQQLRSAVPQPVVVRLGDSHYGLVGESNQALVRDGESELAIKVCLGKETTLFFIARLERSLPAAVRR